MKPARRIRQADIRLLRVFQTIAQAGGISAAELILNIGRSTISRHLSDLEVRLGVKLCYRGPAGFALTEEGLRVFEATNRLLASIENFSVEVNEIHDRLIGSLSVALFDMTITNPDARVSTAFRQFDEIAPDVDLRLCILGADDTERGVLSGEIHVGIVPEHRQSSSLDYYPLYCEDMFLFCGSTHPMFEREPKSISPHEVRSARYAGLAYQSPNMVVSHKEGLDRHALIDDQEALAVLVLSGRYLGFLPDHFAAPYVDNGKLRKIRPDRYRYRSEFFAIIKRHPMPARITQTFLDCLREAHNDPDCVS